MVQEDEEAADDAELFRRAMQGVQPLKQPTRAATARGAVRAPSPLTPSRAPPP